jgi:hypothetical protein
MLSARFGEGFFELVKIFVLGENLRVALEGFLLPTLYGTLRDMYLIWTGIPSFGLTSSNVNPTAPRGMTYLLDLLSKNCGFRRTAPAAKARRS